MQRIEGGTAFCNHFCTLLPVGIPPSLRLGSTPLFAWHNPILNTDDTKGADVLGFVNKRVDFVMRWEETVEIFCTITISPHFS